MGITMIIKNILRRFGFDIVKYHNFYDTVVRPRDIKTLLDVGANVGVFAKEFRARFPEAFIHSFEPLPSCFQELEKALPNDARFKAWNTALGETAGSTMIYHSAFNPSSSLLPMGELHKKIYPRSAKHTEEKILIARLDDVLKDVVLAKPLLIKIDVQGFEASVIRGGGETLKRADIILVENSFVELYEGQALFGEIHNLLQKLGFSYRGRSETHFDPRTNTPIYEDSIFLKN